MPKVSTETTEAPKRAPRKRAVRRVVSSDDAPVRRTRVTAPAREAVETASVRRAPTRMVSTERKNRNKLYASLAVTVFIAGAATWIGVSDAGVIDVDARITEMNERAAQNASENQTDQNGETRSVEIPVQNTPPVVPVSSLRGRGVGTAAVEQPAPVVDESATTTEETTDAAAEEGEAPVEETASEEVPAEGESAEATLAQ